MGVTVDDRLLTTSQVAAMLSVSEKTVQRWADSGRLPCVRVGPRNERLFLASQVDRLRASLGGAPVVDAWRRN